MHNTTNKNPGRVRAAIRTQEIRLASDDFITSNLSQSNCYSVWIMSILLPLILLPKSLRLVLVCLSLPFLAKVQFVVECAPLLRSQHSPGLLLPSNSRQKCMWCAPVCYSLDLFQVQLQWIFKKSNCLGQLWQNGHIFQVLPQHTFSSYVIVEGYLHLFRHPYKKLQSHPTHFLFPPPPHIQMAVMCRFSITNTGLTGRG